MNGGQGPGPPNAGQMGGRGAGRRRRRKAFGSLAELREGDRPSQSQIPHDAGLDRYLGGLSEQSQILTADSEQARGQAFNAYFDPNNPFSRQALAKRTLMQARDGQFRSAAAAGRLNSGQTAARATDVEFEGMRDQDQLVREYQDMFSGIGRDEVAGQRDLRDQAEGAIFQAVQDRARDIEATAAPSMREMGLTAMGRKPRKKRKGRDRDRRYLEGRG